MVGHGPGRGGRGAAGERLVGGFHTSRPSSRRVAGSATTSNDKVAASLQQVGGERTPFFGPGACRSIVPRVGRAVAASRCPARDRKPGR